MLRATIFWHLWKSVTRVNLLKLVTLKDKPWQYRDLFPRPVYSSLEISAHLKRGQKAGLYRIEVRHVDRTGPLKSIQYSLYHVLPTSPAIMVTALGTACSRSFCKGFSRAEMQSPSGEQGGTRGLMIEPFQRCPKRPQRMRCHRSCSTALMSCGVGKGRKSKWRVMNL